MPPLPISKTKYSVMGKAPLIPNHHRPFIPADATAKVEAPDVAVQELQQGIRVLGQEARDTTRDGTIYEEAGLAGHGLPCD